MLKKRFYNHLHELLYDFKFHNCEAFIFKTGYMYYIKNDFIDVVLNEKQRIILRVKQECNFIKNLIFFKILFLYYNFLLFNYYYFPNYYYFGATRSSFEMVLLSPIHQFIQITSYLYN